MGFGIEPGNAVEGEFRRIALEQFDAAIAQLRDPEPDGLAVAVHEARKRCKRLRALFRLVRPSIGERRYGLLNAAVRDAARELSPSRDAQALVDMFDDLVAAHGADRDDADLRLVRSGLEARVAALEDGDAEPGQPVARATEWLELAREATAKTKLDADGFKALRDGLTATYRRGHTALGELRRDGSPEQSHEWRKAVKYTWHHLELLERCAPSVLEPAGKSFHQLSDALGDAHNLVVLADVLEASPVGFGGPGAVETVVHMAGISRADLEQRAIRLGLRLYGETPGAFSRRLHAYWRAERQEGDELPTGELADVAEVPAGDAPDHGEETELVLSG